MCVLCAAKTDHVVPDDLFMSILKSLETYERGNGNAFGTVSTTWELEKMPFRIADVARGMPLIRGEYNNVHLTQFNNHESCEEFARQLTLKESALYLDLNSAEIVQCIVVPGSNPAAEYKLKRQRQFSCLLKRWATHSVLKESDPSKRAKTFAFLARLAEVCIRLRNFSSAHSIYNGLESVHINSLPRTKAVSSLHIVFFHDLLLTDVIRNRNSHRRVNAGSVLSLNSLQITGIIQNKSRRCLLFL